MENDDNPMTVEELEGYLNQLRDQGLTDEDILEIIYEACLRGEIEAESVNIVAEFMGYRMKDEAFKELKEKTKEFKKEGND